MDKVHGFPFLGVSEVSVAQSHQASDGSGVEPQGSAGFQLSAGFLTRLGRRFVWLRVGRFSTNVRHGLLSHALRANMPAKLNEETPKGSPAAKCQASDWKWRGRG